MKNHKCLLAVIALPLLLSSCDLFENLFNNGGYKSYEEYFEQELHYQRATSMEGVNQGIKDNVYWWEYNESTYNGQTYQSYVTGRSNYISVHSDMIFVNTTVDADLTIYRDTNNFFIYAHNDTMSIGVGYEGNRWRIGDSTRDESKLTDEEKAFIHLYVDETGYLIEVKDTFYMYLTKDYSNFYVNENNTSKFKGYENDYEVSIETLSRSNFAHLGEVKYAFLPELENKGEDDYWHGYHYNSKGVPSDYRVVLPGVELDQYADYLKSKGYTVYRAEDEDIYSEYDRKYEGFWYALDESEEVEFAFRDIGHLYHSGTDLFNVKFYGPYHNVEIWVDKLGYKKYSNSGKLTKNDDWTDADKEEMRAYYDLNETIPFMKLGAGYSIPSIMSYAYESALTTVLKYESQCYNIYDMHYHDLTKQYKQVLLENGYHLYDYGDRVDFTNSESIYNWKRTDESKYYKCYINEEKDLAIKVYFDINFGNTIRVFKYSAMEAWVWED